MKESEKLHVVCDNLVLSELAIVSMFSLPDPSLDLSEIPAPNASLHRSLRCGECEALSSGLLNIDLGEETSEKRGIC